MTEYTELTVTEVLDQLAVRGYGSTFRIEEGTVAPTLSCETCQDRLVPERVPVAETWRFEGQTDPDDEAIVLALTCPSCQTGGVWISSYGPDTPTAEAHVLTALDRSPSTGGRT